MTKFRRVCSCGKVWYCQLECEEEYRGKQADFCHCNVCYADDLKNTDWAKADMGKANLQKCLRLKEPKVFVFR